jgi:hypothetical protein
MTNLAFLQQLTTQTEHANKSIENDKPFGGQESDSSKDANKQADLVVFLILHKGPIEGTNGEEAKNNGDKDLQTFDGEFRKR